MCLFIISRGDRGLRGDCSCLRRAGDNLLLLLGRFYGCRCCRCRAGSLSGSRFLRGLVELSICHCSIIL